MRLGFCGIVLMILFLASSVCARVSTNEIVIKGADITRTIDFFGSVIRTTKIEINGKQVLEQPGVEFLIDLDYKGEPVTLVPIDFDVKAIESDQVGDETQTEIELTSHVKNMPIIVYVTYYSGPANKYIQKSVRVETTKPMPGAIIRRVTIDDCIFKSSFSPVTPIDRYAGNSSDNPKADLTDTKTRFKFDETSSFAAMDQNSKIGLFFFTSSLFGKEYFSTRQSLRMYEDLYIPLDKPYETGRATIGVNIGSPEILFKRFREFLWDHYCVMRGKKMLFIYETWINEKQNVSEEKCLEEMKAMQKEGIFNAFHLDYGWENHYPLTEDSEKFPHGLPWLAEQAKSMGLKMVYWINPVGSKGQTTDKPNWGGQWDGLMKDHPDWFATFGAANNSLSKENDALCFNTPYGDYVEQKLLRLVKECGAYQLYNDGNDWNDFKCPAAGPNFIEKKAELQYTAMNRLKSIYDKLHLANPDLVICLSPQIGNTSDHAHRLNTIDQIEFWDGTSGGCLGDRQQRYNQHFIYPPLAMQSGWYVNDMETPFPQVKYVILSTLPGYPQNQGSYLIAHPNPELSAYLKRAFAFKKKFEDYFTAYQHVLDFPDGKSIDGEGHIIDNKGFIMLFNPANEAKKITLPLDEPEMELRGSLKLTDWTELDSGTDMGSAKVGEKVEVEVPAMSVKIVGVNLK